MDDQAAIAALRPGFAKRIYFERLTWLDSLALNTAVGYAPRRTFLTDGLAEIGTHRSGERAAKPAARSFGGANRSDPMPEQKATDAGDLIDVDESARERAWVDGLWSHLKAAFHPNVDRRLGQFIRQQRASKWIIATDFCIRDPSRPNDSFAFVLLPAGSRWDRTEHVLNTLPKRDLKETSRISSAVKRAFHKGRVFTLCFVADRDRRLYLSADAARRSLDRTLALMSRWQNADACQETIAAVRAARQEASKGSVSLRLLEDIVMTAALAAYVIDIVCRHADVEEIGWAPDRDKITEAYSGLAFTLLASNSAAMAQARGAIEPKLGVLTQSSGETWCDPYIRLADYAAGIAAWDPPSRMKAPPKIVELIRDVFADNRYLRLFRVAFRSVGDECLTEVRHVEITKRKPAVKRSEHRTEPLRGRSRKLSGKLSNMNQGADS